MASAIDLVREHFAALSTRKIEVPEWKLTVYASPMTLAEKAKLYRKSEKNDLELLVDILLMKATDATGEKLFTVDDRLTLLNKADSNIVARVANEILSSDAPKADELKN